MNSDARGNTLIVHNEETLKHKLAKKSHPERPERVSSVVKHLSKMKPYEENLMSYQKLLQNLDKSDKQMEFLAKEHILRVHGQKYYDFVEGMWCEGISKAEMFISVDTYYSKQTFQAALEAVKTTLLSLMYGISSPFWNTFAIVRPPGHHSGMKAQPHGFSFFNNIAVAADYFVKTTKGKAVIIDWDIHHGEGTQKIFYERSDVLYISLHRFDKGKYFPHVKESGCEFVGTGIGKGFNINICWNFPEVKSAKSDIRPLEHSVGDMEYLFCFNRIIIPVLEQFKPDAIFISCGFDSCKGDQIGEAYLTQNGLYEMSKRLAELQKPIYLTLEGGYCLKSICWGTEAILQGIKQGANHELSSHDSVPNVELEKLSDHAQNDIKNAMKFISEHWELPKF